MYNEKVLEHFMNPRNVGIIEDADAIGIEGNPVCGDTMKMYLKIKDDIIVDVKFQTLGCGAAIATSSIATEMLKDRPLEEARRMTSRKIADALGGLSPGKIHCSVLAADALKSALASYEAQRQGADTSN
ncbi:MAG: iron-sulfur cluster assembly scaffold protein [Dehalococcoidia bacterium]